MAEFNLVPTVGVHLPPVTDAAVVRDRVKRGHCGTCNTKTYDIRKSLTGREFIPLTIDGVAHHGRCLHCHPFEGNARPGNSSQKGTGSGVSHPSHPVALGSERTSRPQCQKNWRHVAAEVEGWTRNDYDGNLTRGRGRLLFSREEKYASGGLRDGGLFSGSIDWSSGTSYNPAEIVPIVGRWKRPGDKHRFCLGNIPEEFRQWCRFGDKDTVYWEERYHGGQSVFYYVGELIYESESDLGSLSARISQLRGEEQITCRSSLPLLSVKEICGRYKMGGTQASGTFRFWVRKSPKAIACDSKSVTDDEQCIICCSAPICASFVHCDGTAPHKVCCDSCAALVMQNCSICPICRRKLERLERVVFAVGKQNGL